MNAPSISTNDRSNLLQMLLDTSSSRIERIGLLELSKSNDTPETGKKRSEATERAAWVLELSIRLSQNEKLLEAFLLRRRKQARLAVEWWQRWRGPMIQTLVIFVAIALLATTFRSTAVSQFLKDISFEPSRSFNAWNAQVSDHSWFARVLYSFVVGTFGCVLPGVWVVVFSAVVANYWLAGSKALGGLLLRMPVVGNWYRNSETSQFLANTGLLLQAGEPLHAALQFSGRSQSSLTRYVACDLALQIQKGNELSEIVSNERLFPQWLAGWFRGCREELELSERMVMASDLIEAETAWSTSVLSRFAKLCLLWSIGIGILLTYFFAVLQVIQHVTMLSR